MGSVPARPQRSTLQRQTHRHRRGTNESCYQWVRIPWGLAISGSGSHGAWLSVGQDPMEPGFQLGLITMGPGYQWVRIPSGLVTSRAGSHGGWLPVGQDPMGPGYQWGRIPWGLVTSWA